ncbi:DEAD/DEAH box helicase [Cytobacillus gottheilii]|uniref:DEAD/DEAH box helicase n=1 Tax=Cytobacillus gottheilii TaxID=859144 RepID=UPI0009B9969E|nr:DEAD/DEAH box helicase [Cytobacillus gottheilii]
MEKMITHKMVKERCGTISYKRGDAFFRANKVSFESYDQGQCEAIVNGAEPFYVKLRSDESGELQAECTCPKLASYTKDCQHVAAVMLAIHENQRQGRSPITSNGDKHDLTEGLLSLFQKKSLPASSRQRHFENRTVLNAAFLCEIKEISSHDHLLSLSISIQSIKIQHIRAFIQAVKMRQTCVLSLQFTYDPSEHCFHPEVDRFFELLYQMMIDESMFQDEDSGEINISASLWSHIKEFTENIPLKLSQYPFQVSEQTPPLHFTLKDGAQADQYVMHVKGLENGLLFHRYSAILIDSTMFMLPKDQFQQLSELDKMLKQSSANEIPITKEQLDFFIKQVVPGLRKIGIVHIPADIMRTPLQAKLYLDRLNNRLLAGLEFHYEHIIIQPLENREPPAGVRIVRDVQKEDQILELMEEGQFAKSDGGYMLQNEGLEYQFLYHLLPKLQKLVHVYATTAVRNRIFRENPKPRFRVAFKRERTNWLEFKFELDGISDHHIRKLLQALEEKRKYYRLQNGSLLSLESKEFEEIQRFLQMVPSQVNEEESLYQMSVSKGLQFLETDEDGGLFAMEESLRNFFEQLKHPNQAAFPVPESLHSVLRDYQKTGFYWMKTLASYGFGGILADDMGLGKTLQSIAYILSELKDVRKQKQPILIVCPAAVTYNWLQELIKFAPEIEAAVVDGEQKEREMLLQRSSDLDVLITSYPLLLKDRNLYEQVTFQTVFFDEAQAFKNPTTQTAKAVKKINAKQRFALTGTPVENALEELWSIFHVVFPELFGSIKEYSHLTREKISKRIRPFLLRRLKKDVLLELPEKTEMIDSSELLPEQKKLYAAYLAKLRHDTLKHLDKQTLRKNRIKILAGITRLRQICCHPGLFVDGYKGGSAKLEQLIQILQEAQLAGRRVLIFSQFTKMLRIIGQEASKLGLDFFYLDGQTPSAERVDLCTRFNEGERDLFLISLKAGGTGLNLTGADTVILYDLWWNPAVEEQAADRAHRMGQKQHVQVIKLVSRGTVEEKINSLQEKKRDLIDEVLTFEKSLTEEDIVELLR